MVFAVSIAVNNAQFNDARTLIACVRFDHVSTILDDVFFSGVCGAKNRRNVFNMRFISICKGVK